jgi:transcriptional antiterminator RfaH
MQLQHPRWYVVKAHPQREAYAIENLQRQGFETYCPKIMKRRVQPHRQTQVPRPLFPQYVFVSEASVGAQWRVLMSTYGVRTLVRCGDAPGLIDNDFIAALRAREIDGVMRYPEQAFSVGQQVNVLGGALDGLAGKIIELREKDRVVLLLSFLNQQTRAVLPVIALDPA